MSRTRIIVWYGLLIFLAAWWSGPAAAQDEESEPGTLQISSVVADDFPEIQLNFTALDAEGQRIVDLSALEVTEDGVEISDFTTTTVAGGVDLVVVLDANVSILNQDGTGQTRLDTIKESLILFADDYMVPNVDTISVVVVDGDGVSFLVEDAPDGRALAAALDTYNEVDFPDLAPLESMLSLALEHTAQNQGSGRYQALLLYSDANTTFDAAALLAEAAAGPTHIYAAILGGLADETERGNMNQLTTPTDGFHLHMPAAIEALPIFTALQEQGEQFQLSYTSVLQRSGRFEVTLTLDDLTAEGSFRLDFDPATVTLVVNDGDPLVRTVSDFDTPLADAEPQTLAVSLEIVWPDGPEREVMSATLLLDGEELDVDTFEQDGDTLTFEVDVSELDVGEYALEALLVDDYGLEAESEAFTVVVEIIRPDPPPTPTTAATAVPEPTATAVPTGGVPILQNPNFIYIAVGFVVLLLVGLLARFIIRRRAAERDDDLVDLETATSTATGVDENDPFAQNEAFVHATEDGFDLDDIDFLPGLKLPSNLDEPPDTVSDFDISIYTTPDPVPDKQEVDATNWQGAYLEVVEKGPEDTLLIPLQGENITIGRDGSVAQVVLGHQSVSRLHARIVDRGGSFLLYDEGSGTGTFLNFKRIGLAPQPIKDNDEIHIGRVRLRFRMGGMV